MNNGNDLYLRPVGGLPAWVGRWLTKVILGVLSMREQALPGDADYGKRRYFDRSRFIYPRINADAWALTVMDGKQSRTLSLADIHALPRTTSLSVQECAGNGNHWMGSAGLLGQARWEGPLLSDVLAASGLSSDKEHLVFRGADGLGLVRQGYHFGLSLTECVQAGALLATHMNGVPLSCERGAPVRLVVPGIYSMCHVKWLASIEHLASPHRGLHNTLIYVNKEYIDGKWVKVQPRWIGLKSLIHRCHRVDDGWTLTGVAWGGDSPIVAVEVSTDGGDSWQKARLDSIEDPDHEHAWRPFSYQWPASSGRHRVGSVAISANGLRQPLAIPDNVSGHYDQCDVKWRLINVPTPQK